MFFKWRIFPISLLCFISVLIDCLTRISAFVKKGWKGQLSDIICPFCYFIWLRTSNVLQTTKHCFTRCFFAASERGNILARKQNTFAKMLRGRTNSGITGMWNRVFLPMFYGWMHRKMKTPVIYKRVKSYFDRESFACMLFKTVDAYGPREMFYGRQEHKKTESCHQVYQIRFISPYICNTGKIVQRWRLRMCRQCRHNERSDVRGYWTSWEMFCLTSYRQFVAEVWPIQCTM